MAASSTEAFASNSQNLSCFNLNIKNDTEKFWSTEVMATATTGGFWEDDPEEALKKRVNELKRKFHSGRQLQIKHLPRDVLEEEIRELLSDLPVQSVQLQCGTGSGMARASLDEPELLDEWDRERVFVLRGQRVPVVPTPTEMMLCVARLPPTFTETQFSTLVRTYGEVCKSFLMISEKTGDSKGYGFVEYATKEAALQAKNMLDGKQLDGYVTCCEWLDSSHVTFTSLHSKCLYVDRLPKDFRDMGEFRKIFGTIVNPPYCQIALKNGCPQDWGLVEFSASVDAEQAQQSLDGYILRGQSIRISYYIPGVRAINLYLKLLNDSGNKTKASGLLPDPPAPAVFQQLHNLAKQNPAFAQSLQNIIWSQIQSLQNGLPIEDKKSSIGVSNSGQGGPSGKNKTSSPVQTSTTPPAGQQYAAAAAAAAAVANENNAHAALVLLLAAQMQSQISPPVAPQNLLGSPQMLNALQNIMKMSSPPATTVSTSSTSNSASTTNFQYGTAPHQKPTNKNGFKSVQGQKVPLLPNPNNAISPPPGEVASRPSYANLPTEDAAAVAAAVASGQSSAGVLGISPHLSCQMPGPTADANLAFWNNILGQLQSHSPQPNPTQTPLGINQIDTGLVEGDIQSTINSLLSNAQNLNQLLGTISTAMQNGSGATRSLIASNPGAPQPSPFTQFINPNESWTLMNVAQGPRPTNPNDQNGRPILGNPTVRPLGRPILGSPVHMPVPPPPPKQMGFLDMKTVVQPPPFQNQWHSAIPFTSPPPTPLQAGTPPPFGGYPVGPPSLWSHPGSPILVASPTTVGMMTPIGQKRKYNRLLPSPEPSPEGNYIGQHSQGLGGHYADSYFKRKKKN